MRLLAGAHGVIHDLESASSLSEFADSVLIVSDRTLYVINNLLETDAGFYSRWSTAFEPGMYEPVAPDSSDSALVDYIVNQARLDVMPINTDLVDALLAIAESLADRPETPAGCGTGEPLCLPLVTNNPIASCLGNLTPEQAADPGAPDAPEPGTPPDGFATWGEYQTYKCAAAWSMVRAIEAMAFNIAVTGFGLPALQGVTLAILGAMAGIAVVFPPALLAEVLAAVAAMTLLEAGSGYLFSQIHDYVKANEDDLVCQLYASGNAADAIDAIAGVIEDAIQAIAWGEFAGLATPLGSAIGSVMALVESNSFVTPLFRLVTDIVSTGQPCDCPGGCGVYLNFGTFEAGVYSAEINDGAYYLDIEFNSSAHLTTCGDAATVVDTAVLSGSLNNAGTPIYRLYNNGWTDLQHGDGEPTWPVSGCRGLTVTSTTMFTMSVDWF